jgi:dienelactone hydrolase
MCRLSLLALLTLGPPLLADPPKGYPEPAQVKTAFLHLLDRPRIPLDVRLAGKSSQEGLVHERLTFASEKKAGGNIERVPVLVVRPVKAEGKLPAVIVLHGTGGSARGQVRFLTELARRGIIGVAIDARYHGERSGGAKGAAAYNEAITRAWRAKGPQEHPFYYDTCWDLWRTVDYLVTRRDVDPNRLGMIGFSMGGIETWMAAAVDPRIKVSVPAIALQSFRWSLENDRWQGRARTIQAAHVAAAKDLGEPAVNQKVCRALWEKIVPGILDQFDCPSMIRLFAGRPLLILSGSRDGNCPYEGAKLAIAAAENAYKAAGASDRLRVMVADVGHTVTAEQRKAALDWFTRWLR